MVGPHDLDVGGRGRLVVADRDGHRVLLIEPLAGEPSGAMGEGMPGPGP